MGTYGFPWWHRWAGAAAALCLCSRVEPWVTACSEPALAWVRRSCGKPATLHRLSQKDQHRSPLTHWSFFVSTEMRPQARVFWPFLFLDEQREYLTIWTTCRKRDMGCQCFISTYLVFSLSSKAQNHKWILRSSQSTTQAHSSHCSVIRSAMLPTLDAFFCIYVLIM